MNSTGYKMNGVGGGGEDFCSRNIQRLDGERIRREQDPMITEIFNGTLQKK